MICQPCRDRDHDKCDDKMRAVELPAVKVCKDPWIGRPPHCGKDGCPHLHGEQRVYMYKKRKGRLYRSCACQHKVRDVQPLATAQTT